MLVASLERNSSVPLIATKTCVTVGDNTHPSGQSWQRVIYSLRLAELGEVFVYDSKAAREEVREASQMETVPIIAMKK
jgi:hypothetical protein